MMDDIESFLLRLVVREKVLAGAICVVSSAVLICVTEQ